jgi:4'-phosphopantetheinyl transferase
MEMGSGFPPLPIAVLMNLPDHIAYAYRRLDDVPLDEARELLSREERQYLDGIRLEKRRREFTAGRVVARELAGRVLGQAPASVALIVKADGSLELGGTACGISLAHTHEGVCAAVARDTAIGIDLETIKPRHQDLLRFMLHPDEYGLLDTLPLSREHSLILCWVLKEATLKGMRTGFRCSPKNLRLAIDVASQRASIRAPGGMGWQAHYEERDGSYLALAFPSTPNSNPER